jgi:DNA/RNA endonuclease G (NUC1)
MKKLGLFLVGILTIGIVWAQSLRTEVVVKNQVFQVSYNEVLEGPNWIIYHATNRPTNVNRGSMDFYTEKGIKTSDAADYKANIYDKGHMAPAAHFSDNMENLKQTFSYLNCSLQDQYLNRGEWRLLEEQERKWDDAEPLTIKIIPVYEKGHLVLPTGGHVPTAYHKHISWKRSGKKVCYYFPNSKPTKGWEDYVNRNCKLLN